jgi:type I restriction enzyme M protein
MSDVVQRLWGFCHTLRHDGIDYGEYIEQITFLLFLKMADEKGISLPEGCRWPDLRDASGTELGDTYIDLLRALAKQPGMLGAIYAGAQSRFKNPVNLKKLVALIDETEWSSLGVDIKAAAYEGLLEKAASEGKKGAGQYFTPRVLIQSIVRCMKPDPRERRDFTVCDPACGTGGFLVSAYEWLMGVTKGALEREVAKRVKKTTYHGWELVDRPRRLALMNLYLHGIEPDIRLGDTIYEPPTTDRFDVVLTNPPFGTKGANQNPEREDFTISTSNKQLNFVQHVLTILKPGGRAAIVLPDDCLFADRAGEVFRILAEECDIHTVLRLPRGTFTPYSQGVRANVVFFTKGTPTERIWIYDARTNVASVTKKGRPLSAPHFADFETCYGRDPNGRARRKTSDSREDRWRVFSIDEARARDFKLQDFKWLKEQSLDDGDDLPEAEDLIAESATALQAVVTSLGKLLTSLNPGKPPTQASDDDVPEGWARVSLGALGSWTSGGTPSKSRADLWRGGSFPWVSPKDMKTTFISDAQDHVTERAIRTGAATVAPDGAVLMVVRGMILAHTFPVALTMRPVAFNQDIRALVPHEGISPQFLVRLLQYEAAQILFSVKEATHGTLRLDSDTIFEWPVLLPPSDEQKRIVTALEALLAEVDVARVDLCSIAALFDRAESNNSSPARGSTRLDRVSQTIFAKAFRGELVPTEAEIAHREGRNYEPTSALLERIRAAQAVHATKAPRRRTRIRTAA